MKKRIVSLLCVLVFVLSIGTAHAEAYTFSVDQREYSVDIPDAYLVYTSSMGQESPLLKLTGATASSMDLYMAALGSSVCCVHREYMHQMWISVKDRSSGLGTVEEGGSLPKDIIKAYYDGVAFSRGSYSVETIDGREYYLFANGKSINAGGINYYISTMMGHYEVSVRWESGNGARTESDIAELKSIIASIQFVQ